MSICRYCEQSKFDKNTCLGCGASVPMAIEPRTVERHEPFSYNGYIVWPLRDYMRDTCEYHFYLGMTLVEVISFSTEMYREMFPPSTLGTDPMPYIWQMFEVSQGNQDAAVVMEREKRWPAAFAVVRRENPRMENLTWEGLVEMYKLQGGDLLR